MANSPPIDVSAIIITRNEERNVVESIKSVLNSLEAAVQRGQIHQFETVLVDSASTDQTVLLASAFPIRVTRLRPGWPLSAAAGRATGARVTTGKFLLFIDGDFRLDPDWVAEALQRLDDESVGAITGRIVEEMHGSTMLSAQVERAFVTPAQESRPIESVGIGFVRRSAYDGIGGVHPFLRGAEDRDLGVRLVAAGWKVVETGTPIGTHRWGEPGKDLTFVEYYQSVAVWSLGDGQACRARWADKRVRDSFLERYITTRFLIQDGYFALLLSMVLVNLLPFLAGFFFLMAGLAIDATVVLVLLAWKSRSGRSWGDVLFALQTGLYGPLRQVLFFIGLTRRLPSPESYPDDVEILSPPSAPAVPP